MKTSFINRLVFIFVVIGGFSLRLYNLSSVPPRPTIDEMSIGYNAYSILKTGRDEWGKMFPLIFRAFGDYKLPAYIYATIPFVAAFGLNTLAVRTVSLLAGTLLIYLIYKLASHFSHQPTLGLIAAAITAVSPWPVEISRLGLESNLALCFFTAGLLSFMSLLKKKKPYLAVLTGLFWGLTFYSYVAYRLIIMLVVIALVLYAKKTHLAIPQTRLLIVTLGLTLIPLVPGLLNAGGTARFSQISIFHDIGYVSEINEDRSFCLLSGGKTIAKLCPLWINKPVNWTLGFFHNYLQFLSPSFLMLTGDELKYLQVPGFGEFSLVFIPFYILGIITAFKNRHHLPFALLILGWLVSPIPSALAGAPQTVRGSALIPFVIIFISLGVLSAYHAISSSQYRRLFNAVVILLCLAWTWIFFFNYLVIYPAQYDDVAYPLPPQLGMYLSSHQSDYDHIYFTPIGPGLHMFIAYYTRMDPVLYQNTVVWPVPDALGFTHPQQLNKYQITSNSMSDLICNQGVKSGLYITTNNFHYRPEQSFYSYAGVNLQAQIFDLATVATKIDCAGVTQ